MALTSEKLLPAEYARLRFAITPEPHETLADVVQPKYWVHAASKLKPHSIIEVVPSDGSYYAELFVESCGHIWANMRILRVVVFDETATKEKTQTKTVTKVKVGDGKEIPEADNGTDHYVDWGGPQNKGRVIRKSDKQIVQQGLPTKDAARAWMKEHEDKAKKVSASNDTDPLIGKV